MTGNLWVRTDSRPGRRSTMQLAGMSKSFWRVERSSPVVRVCACGALFVPAPDVGRADECSKCHVIFRRIIKGVRG